MREGIKPVQTLGRSHALLVSGAAPK